MASTCVPDKIAELLACGADDDAAGRVARLTEIRAAVQDESLDGLTAIVEKLADRAKDRLWRAPIGDSGLLEFVLSAVPADEPQHPLNKQALRLVGNACADCDENRARVVESGALRGFIMGCLKEDALLRFAIAATLNLCVDYEPAQAQASQAGLSKVLVDMVSGDRLASCKASLSHIMTILELLCNQDSEPKVADPHTPALLLRLATSERYDSNLDRFMEICTPALAYLTFQNLQLVFMQNGGIELLQVAFHQLYTRFDVEDLDLDTSAQLQQVSDAFLAVFADISALPDFSTTCPLDSKAVQTLIAWLELPPALSELQIAACLSLGNLARSDESSTALLRHVRLPLIEILSLAVPPTTSQRGKPRTHVPRLQLFHAALSFLKNLAIAPANKSDLGATALLQEPSALLPRLWSSTRTQPQLQFAAVSLTRLLLTNCPPNIRWICKPAGPNSPHRSNLALLASIAASADEEPIKIEAARAAGLVCRALHAPSSAGSTTTTTILDPSWTWPDPTPSSWLPSSSSPKQAPPTATTVLTRFYASHARELTTSLALLLTHPRFPSLRSEAIFTLALMSRSGSTSPSNPPHPGSSSSSPDPDPGARTALQVLQHPASSSSSSPSDDGAAAWRVLAEAISGAGSAEARAVATAAEAAAQTLRGRSSAAVGENAAAGAAAAEAEAAITAEAATATTATATTATATTAEEEEEEAAAEAGGDDTLDDVVGGQKRQVDGGQKREGHQESKEEEESKGVKKGDAGVSVERLSLEPQRIDSKVGAAQQPAQTAKMDRENGMVLVAELLRKFPDELSSMRGSLEALLSRGGELLAQDRAQKRE
ncbi:be1e871d-a8aa-4dfb-b23a-3cc85b9217c8 [Thermothielavioides terrestris]|uniref:Be1e871d-a8aa-4dfb-b23a-3cc85b9217c8 n=1 Tax=Thermothielavioides terrestris TaxID=2587410 RepID=A0A3S4CBT1_9PEZI|nr:be1e871d-a8aa-4dfb-b23a-3cc85b9217c8 [Thermothielavioides terrestris]